MNTNFRFFCFMVLALFVPSVSVGANRVSGWDFDITNVETRGNTIYVKVCSRSDQGLNGPVMITCTVGGKDFTENQVHFDSAECKTVRFDIPLQYLFSNVMNPQESAQGTTKKMEVRNPTVVPVEVRVKGGGIAGFGYGSPQFDFWSRLLEFRR